MTTPSTDRAYSAPIVDAFTAAFWEGTKAGVFNIRKCNACGKVHWYPRPLCPYCLSDATAWVASTGLGEIYTFTVHRGAGAAPYALAYVRLDDGVTVMTNLVDCDLDQLSIGQRVQMRFKPAEGDQCIPVFAPVLTGR